MVSAMDEAAKSPRPPQVHFGRSAIQNIITSVISHRPSNLAKFVDGVIRLEPTPADGDVTGEQRPTPSAADQVLDKRMAVNHYIPRLPTSRAAQGTESRQLREFSVERNVDAVLQRALALRGLQQRPVVFPFSELSLASAPQAPNFQKKDDAPGQPADLTHFPGNETLSAGAVGTKGAAQASATGLAAGALAHSKYVDGIGWTAQARFAALDQVYGIRRVVPLDSP